MDIWIDGAILCLAAATGGAINSVAGGGTLLTFPALFSVLGPFESVLANGTSTVALLPGSIAGMAAYRRELSEARGWALLLIVPSLLGGLIGAFLLIGLREELFEAAVPWLILTAALLFSLQPRIARWSGVGQEHAPASRGARVGVMIFQFLVGVYGGYFGAGIGILMLSALALMGLGDIHRMNALKTLFASCINAVAAVVLISSGKVHWPFALMMAVAAIAGGYGGARVARRLDKNLVRNVVSTIGYSLAAYYLFRQFSAS